MTLKVPAVVSWDLDTVITQVDNLRSDEGWFLDSAEAVRSAAQQNLGGFAGNTISAATQGCNALSRDTIIVARKAASVVKTDPAPPPRPGGTRSRGGQRVEPNVHDGVVRLLPV